MEMYHRDLKPQNVLIYKDDVSGDVFYAISDFGFVSLKDSRLSKLTYTGMKKGADYYTAPEITKSLGDASAQADIYSLGCIIHDMIGSEDRVPCGEIREDGPYGGLLLNCTRSKPDRRFKSVDVVRDVLLSIDDAAVPVQSAAAIDLAASLDSDDPLSDVALRTLAEFLEDNQGSPDAIALLRKFNIEKISTSWPTEKGATKKIGFQFVEWISQPSAFDFEYCDVLTNRADAFIAGGDIDIKAEMVLALLILGTSHNRWYPEKRFMAHCSPNMDQGLAKRVSVEIRARGKEICQQFDHIENSISVSRNQLHPAIVQALSETCV